MNENRKGTMNNLTVNQIRERITKAGVHVEYQSKRIRTWKEPHSHQGMNWQQTWNDPEKERLTLLAIAEQYGVALA